MIKSVLLLLFLFILNKKRKSIISKLFDNKIESSDQNIFLEKNRKTENYENDELDN